MAQGSPQVAPGSTIPGFSDLYPASLLISPETDLAVLMDAVRHGLKRNAREGQHAERRLLRSGVTWEDAMHSEEIDDCTF